MYALLSDIRVVELASFVAGPSSGLHLAQLGAEVIRVDPTGGGPDFNRWPLTDDGRSLYWEGLNKGKRSVELDLRSADGVRQFDRLLTPTDRTGGVLVTNLPVNKLTDHERLRQVREDVIVVRITGWGDGKPAVDYTVNCVAGYPALTGAVDSDAPTNHVLPAWDLLCGAYTSFAVMSALHHRQSTGQGLEIRIPLGDIALASMANLGHVGEVAATGRDRPRIGNDLFGAFGSNFTTADGRGLMVVAITPRQWSGLLSVLGIDAAVAALEAELACSFAADEGLRFLHRDRLKPLIAAAIERRALAELGEAFDAAGVCWGPYWTVAEALRQEPRLSTANPVFSDVHHASGLTYLTAGAPATVVGHTRQAPAIAPTLGADNERYLSTADASS